MGEAEVRPERPEDADAVDALHREAFGERGAAVVALVADLRRTAAVALVAVDGAAVQGHVLVTPCLVDAEREQVPALVLSPLAVRADVRRRGIGGALVEAAVRAADAAGAPMVLLEGDPAYYGRFGFVVGAARGLRRPSLRIPEAGFQVRVLPAWRPWMTGTMVCPDVWWRHDMVGLRAPGAR